MKRAFAAAALACALIAPAARAAPDPARAIDAYLRPYVESGNFAGVVRVERGGKLIFERAYGFADRTRRIANTPATRFHIASISMQYTAAATMRLVDTGALRLDSRVGDLVTGLPGAEAVTVRDLLMERSGLPDINDRDDYAEILKRRQTPRTLVDAIAGKPLLFPPGSKFLHEEHSAYNLLALILEAKTGRPYPAALRELVFAPLGLAGSGADDDSAAGRGFAVGDQPKGVYGLERAEPIHWSAKAGNASVYVTAADQARWVRALFEGGFLSPAARDAVIDPAERVGYGWFKSDSKRFGGRTLYMNGRAPGFAAFVLYLPRERLTVVALSNVYSSSTTTIGYDITDLMLGKTVTPFRPAPAAPPAAGLVGQAFRFGPDFYQPNIALSVVAVEGGVGLQWAPGTVTPLIPLGEDRFVDRAYWTDVTLRRDAGGRITGLGYDRFEGHREAGTPAAAPAGR